MPSSNSQAVARFVTSHGSTAIQDFAQALVDGRIERGTTAVLLQGRLGMSPTMAAEAAALLEGKDPQLVAAVLLAAVATRSVAEARETRVELVWTGPDLPGQVARPTGAVVEELIRVARSEILLVGYSLSPEGERMSEILRLLSDATRRGVQVTVVLHSDNGTFANRDNLLRSWPVESPRPRILTWRPPSDFPYTKLHAKAVVVDRSEALVTSANLTFHGLESNLELGVRAKGGIAGAIASRFDLLIARGVLAPLRM